MLIFCLLKLIEQKSQVFKNLQYLYVKVLVADHRELFFSNIEQDKFVELRRVRPRLSTLALFCPKKCAECVKASC